MTHEERIEAAARVAYVNYVGLPWEGADTPGESEAEKHQRAREAVMPILTAAGVPELEHDLKVEEAANQHLAGEVKRLEDANAVLNDMVRERKDENDRLRAELERMIS